MSEKWDAWGSMRSGSGEDDEIGDAEEVCMVKRTHDSIFGVMGPCLIGAGYSI
jgi:hypothetical protein